MGVVVKLARRKFLFDAEARRQQPALRAFLAPQRAHLKQPMPERESKPNVERKAA